MSSVAVIACDHGLGHVRRCVLVADELATRGHDVTLLAPVRAVERIRRTLPAPTASPDPVILEFATMTTPSALRAGDPLATDWHERLPALDGFERVVADTLPEVLAVRPDAVLLAQFLWHDVLDGIDESYWRRAAMLVRAAPLVIGSEPFAMPAVRALSGFRGVGLYARRAVDDRAGTRRGDGLLITGGTTDALRPHLEGFVAALVEGGSTRWGRVHVDRLLLPAAAPSWLVEAAYTPAMYDDIAAAVVRPGLGTLTELLVRDARIVCVREAGNAELEHNASTVIRLGRGVDLGAASEVTWQQVAAALLSEAHVGDPPEMLTLPSQGAREAVDLILT